MNSPKWKTQKLRLVNDTWAAIWHPQPFAFYPPLSPQACAERLYTPYGPTPRGIWRSVQIKSAANTVFSFDFRLRRKGITTVRAVGKIVPGSDGAIVSGSIQAGWEDVIRLYVILGGFFGIVLMESTAIGVSIVLSTVPIGLCLLFLVGYAWQSTRDRHVLLHMIELALVARKAKEK